MEDYSQGKIYKIISSECDLVYYGSTVETLDERLRIHLEQYKRYLKEKFNYITSFKLLEKENYEIVLVENYPCNSKKELRLREGEYIKNNQCVNKRIEGRTKKQYREDNRDIIRQKKKIYREENREIISQQRRQYREENREKILERKNKKICCEICGFEGSISNLSRHQKSKKCLEHNNIINI
jgi:hypothetical protein